MCCALRSVVALGAWRCWCLDVGCRGDPLEDSRLFVGRPPRPGYCPGPPVPRLQGGERQRELPVAVGGCLPESGQGGLLHLRLPPHGQVGLLPGRPESREHRRERTVRAGGRLRTRTGAPPRLACTGLRPRGGTASAASAPEVAAPRPAWLPRRGQPGSSTATAVPTVYGHTPAPQQAARPGNPPSP